MDPRRRRFYRPVVEALEGRIVPYTLSGQQWANLNISVSLMPDGTQIGSQQSNLFATYDAKYSQSTWEYQFARALQAWAAVTPLNFHFVTDDGSAGGSPGPVQGDSEFGDIRLGAYPSTGAYLAYSYYPYPTTTSGGDIFLNSRQTYNIGSNYDLYSVLLHEVGHALGLGESNVVGSVMYSTISKVFTGLTPDDIAGIQAIYGPRPADTFDTTRPNNTFLSAASLSVSGSGDVSLTNDIGTIGDLDYYRLRVPADTNGTATVTMDASGLSLLSPNLAVYNGAERLLAKANAGSAYGPNVDVSLTGLKAGQTIYVRAAGNSADVFGIGAYQLDVHFGEVTGAVAGAASITAAVDSSTATHGGLAVPENHTTASLTQPAGSLAPAAGRRNAPRHARRLQPGPEWQVVKYARLIGRAFWSRLSHDASWRAARSTEPEA